MECASDVCSLQEASKSVRSSGRNNPKNNARGRKLTKDQLKRFSLQFVSVSPPNGSLPLLPNLLLS
jgi:hypothetical protein